jgi:hypothetical protein
MAVINRLLAASISSGRELSKEIGALDVESLRRRRRAVPGVTISVGGVALCLRSDQPHILRFLESHYVPAGRSHASESAEVFITDNDTPKGGYIVLTPYRVVLARNVSDDALSCIALDLATEAVSAKILLRDHRGIGPRLISPENSGVPTNLADLVEDELVGTLRTMGRSCLVHAGSSCAYGSALLLCGSSGSGKTTLTIALSMQGFRLLNDDKTCLNIAAGTVSAFPSRPRVRCSSANLLGAAFTVDALQSVLKADGATPNEKAGGGDESYPLTAIIFLDHFGKETSLQPLGTDEAASCLMRQIAVRPCGSLPEFFFQVRAMVGRIKCYRLIAGELASTVEVLISRACHPVPRVTGS